MIKISQNPDTPLYRRIVEAVHQALMTGDLQPGERLPALLVLARSLGVNPTTVRNAYDILENEGMVCSKAGSGTYVTPDAHLRLEKFGRRQYSSIAVVVGNQELASCSREKIYTTLDILTGVTKAMGPGTSFTYAQSLSRASLSHIPDDAAVLLREKQGFESTFADELIRRGIPIIGMWSDPLSYPIPNVHYDTRQAARLAVNHLIDCGYRRIGYIGELCGNEIPMVAKIYEFTHSLLQAGMDYQAGHICHAMNQPGMAYQAAMNIIRSGDCPEAFFVDTDYKAMEVIAALRHAGLDVPKDVGVVAYDDIPEAANFCVPLTTVRTPRRKAGESIAQLLLNWSADHPAQDAQFLTSELVVRQTTRMIDKHPAVPGNAAVKSRRSKSSRQNTTSKTAQLPE